MAEGTCVPSLNFKHFVTPSQVPTNSILLFYNLSLVILKVAVSIDHLYVIC